MINAEIKQHTDQFSLSQLEMGLFSPKGQETFHFTEKGLMNFVKAIIENADTLKTTIQSAENNAIIELSKQKQHQ